MIDFYGETQLWILTETVQKALCFIQQPEHGRRVEPSTPHFMFDLAFPSLAIILNGAEHLCFVYVLAYLFPLFAYDHLCDRIYTFTSGSDH